MDEETESIRDLRTGKMHLRYTDEGEQRTLTPEQRKQARVKPTYWRRRQLRLPLAEGVSPFAD